MTLGRKPPLGLVALILAPSLLAVLVGLGLYLAQKLEASFIVPPQTLAEAIHRGTIESVLQHLVEDEDLNATVTLRDPKIDDGRPFQATPLVVAAVKGSMRLVGLILDTGVDPNSRGNEQALCAAVIFGHGNVQDLLILRGADPNPDPKCDGGRRSPLRVALDLGLDDPAQRLRSAGALEDY